MIGRVQAISKGKGERRERSSPRAHWTVLALLQTLATTGYYCTSTNSPRDDERQFKPIEEEEEEEEEEKKG